MRDYRKIKGWQKADDLTVEVYKVSKTFPKEEIYGLTSQLRRASYSVPSNIAEGSARGTQKEFLHFLYIARASLSEVQYFLHLSQRLSYLTEEREQALQTDVKLVFGLLHGLIRSVEKESGRLAKAVATTTSALVVCFSRLFSA